jgi:hypothetical protein
MIGLLFALQAGLIWWFSPRAPVPVRPPSDLPRITLGPDRRTPLPGESNPLLFGPATPDGFSGPTWLEMPAIPQPPDELHDPPRWLALDRVVLGSSFTDLVKRRSTEALLARLPGPEVNQPVTAKKPPIETPSRLTFEAGIAQRAPALLPVLPDWTNDSPLAPTALDVGVDADGHVFSVTLSKDLGPSGHVPADQFALTNVWTLAFRPLPNADGGPTPGPIAWGRLVFHWRTVPQGDTNPPPAGR